METGPDAGSPTAADHEHRGFEGALTSDERKRSLYGMDTYFVEALEDVRSALGAGANDFPRLHTALLLKPEVLETGRATLIPTWLSDHAFGVVADRVLQLDRHAVRALWRYHWNSVTRDHKRLVDSLCVARDCRYMLIRSLKPNEVNAAQRLARLKGPADPAHQRPSHLRFQLGSTFTLLNFVHSPDDAADFVRELGVLFDEKDRLTLLNVAASETSLPPSSYGGGGTRRLDLDEALSAIRSRWPRTIANANLHNRLDAVEVGAKPDWRRLLVDVEAIRSEGEEVDDDLDWALIVLGAHLLNSRLTGVDPQLQTIGHEAPSRPRPLSGKAGVPKHD